MNQINTKYAVKDNQLTIEDTLIPFDFPIAQVIEVEGMLIIRLEIPVTVIYNENVFGVSVAEKKIRWQIEKRNYDPHMKSCPFIEIRIFEGELRLNNWCSVYFIVDPLTGEILKDGWTR
jgi:hypothetical protein